MYDVAGMGELGYNGGDNGTGRQAASLGAAMSDMAEAIGRMVAGQQEAREWAQQERGSGRGKPGNSGSSGTWLEITPEAAVPMPDVQKPRRIAYVDGGNATLPGSPGWSAGFNRVAYAVCQGERVHQPRYVPRVDFL